MIIFGWKGVTLTGDKGAFHCPSCGAGTRYEQKKVRRFFTLYFIPLIPLEKLAEYIECQGCQGTYNSDVLTYDPAAQERTFRTACHEAILRVMTRMIAADGRIDPAEVETVHSIYKHLTGKELAAGEIEAECAVAMGATTSVSADVEKVAPTLNNNGRELVLKAALHVAYADGDVSPAEWEVVTQLAQALGVSPAHLRGIHEELINAPVSE